MSQGLENFSEHRIPHGSAKVFTRDYAGDGPAFVLMHGLPDNQRIYDDLIPYLVAAGRRVVTFDFLGFGASDKPAGGSYSYRQQLDDLEAVVQTLALGPVVLVPHDSSGFAGINFAIEHPDRVASVCMLNSAYADADTVHWPEMIELAAKPSLRALSSAILQDPAQFGWLLTWQQQKFKDCLPENQKAHFQDFIGQVIADNFIKAPSAGPAYAQMTAQFYEEIARNIERLPRLEALGLPIKLIWGEFDPYFPVSMAKARLAHLKHGSLHVVPAGHWLQSDQPELVAKELLT
ncbi:alpha/beta fold hydrolase [Rhodoplanes sp. Z2-YC6860]|uniref:alpha/beta fold hydrolase n=1 Tax=Rhodoplanes sp. Z2-YC6860 TaxID=674703 RepID=UPI00078C25B3|nr:alpha/beta hydrolase [Rhodoplanes sp. Z2-YC6860]AMN44731.1 alpha/beta hydrolase fold protein [Rhodoplanes sp. Z2-YC6860]